MLEYKFGDLNVLFTVLLQREYVDLQDRKVNEEIKACVYVLLF